TPDSPNDSTFTPGKDEVGRLLVTWDATNLYIGFDFSVEGAAVIYYIQGPAQGAKDFCAVNDFKAGAQTSELMDVMVAFYKTGAVTGFRLAAGQSMLDNSITGARTANPADGSLGVAEAAIPWTTLFSGGVPAGATIKLVGAVRGNNDG